MLDIAPHLRDVCGSPWFVILCLGIGWVVCWLLVRLTITSKHKGRGRVRVTYADYAGTPLPLPLPLSSTITDTPGSYANPHSDVSSDVLSSMPSSRASISALRQVTLRLCNAPEDKWVCIITSGATAAIKLAAESFPWTREKSFYLYLADNHTSVVGIREIAAHHGAATGVVRKSSTLKTSNLEHPDTGDIVHSLFAFPLESNFNGARYSPAMFGVGSRGFFQQQDVTWVHPNQPATFDHSLTMMRWHVLLDAARGCATQPPDLSKEDYQSTISFVALSYYKILGYPTGLGALLVRKDVLSILHRNYFGGGTVSGCVVDRPVYKLRAGPEAFEDGTLPFLTIPSAVQGMERWLQAGGPRAAAADGCSCAARLAEQLQGMTHYNGVPVCCLYGSGGSTCSIVTFNIRNSTGGWVGPRQVRRIAALEGVFLRAGTLCNPGACADALRVDGATVASWIEAGRDCDDEQSDLINGQPTGVVRASFGFGSSLKDVQCIVNVISMHFVETCRAKGSSLTSPSPSPSTCPGLSMRISRLFIYPIKSAAPQAVSKWPLDVDGNFLWDRQFAVLDASGQALTMRRCPMLLEIKPKIDLKRQVMTINPPYRSFVEGFVGPGHKELVVPLYSQGTKVKDKEEQDEEEEEEERLCYGGEWFSRVLGMKCKGLVRFKRSGFKSQDTLHDSSFANRAQYLVTSQPSLDMLYSYARQTINNLRFSSFTDRFRPNIVVKGESMVPFEEDEWTSIRFFNGEHSQITLTVVDSCKRCTSICIDPRHIGNGPNTELLTCLARLRRGYGRSRLNFGVLAGHVSAEGSEYSEDVPKVKFLAIGMGVQAERGECRLTYK